MHNSSRITPVVQNRVLFQNSLPLIKIIRGRILNLVHILLALLDYVSRANEIEIRPSSVVRRPSSVRLWHRLSLKLLHGFLQILVMTSPGHMPRNLFRF